MNSRWISVSKELPGGNDNVWVVRTRKDGAILFGVGWMSTAERWRVYGDNKSEGDRVDDVTHWMPIPPLPSKPDPVREALKLADAALCEDGRVTRREARIAIARAEAELNKGRTP